MEDGSVRYGLAAVKNLGRSFINAAVKERENGDFVSAADFAMRMADKDNNRRYMEALICCGAFDGFPSGERVNRRRLLQGLNALLEHAARESSRRESGQLDLFEQEENGADFTFPQAEDYGKTRLLLMEKEYLGRYISGHPADEFLDRAPDNCMFISDAVIQRNGAEIAIAAVCLSERRRTAKNGASMSIARFEDRTGELEAMIFPNTFERIDRFREGEVYIVRGKISVKENRVSFFVDSASPAAQLPARQRSILYVNLPSFGDSRTAAVTSALFAYRGVSEARICFGDTRTVHKVNGLPGVRICPALLGRLKKLCGEENIKVGFLNRNQP